MVLQLHVLFLLDLLGLCHAAIDLLGLGEGLGAMRLKKEWLSAMKMPTWRAIQVSCKHTLYGFRDLKDIVGEKR